MCSEPVECVGSSVWWEEDEGDKMGDSREYFEGNAC
jgi:hypothetical protein